MAGRLLAAAITLFLFSLLSRALSPADFGKLLFYVNIFFLLATAVEFGIPQVALRKISIEPENSQGWLQRAAADRMFLAPIGIAAIVTLAVYYGDTLGILLILSFFHFLTLPVTSYGLIFQKEIRYLPPAICRLSGILLSLAACFAMVAYGIVQWEWHLVSILGGLSFSHIALFLLARKKIPTDPSSFPAGSLLKLAWPLGISILIQQLYFRSGHFFVRSLAEEELHLFTAPFQLFVLALMVPQYLTAAALPALAAENQKGREHFDRLLKWLLRTLLFLGIPAAAIAFGFGSNLLRLAFGELYTPGEETLRWLAIAGLAILFGSVATTGIVALGQSKKILALSWIALLCSLPLGFLLTSSFGAAGAAAAAATEIVVGILSWIVLLKWKWKDK